MATRAIPRPEPRSMYRVVLALAWPVMAEMALQTLTQMVDMAMVGRLGATAIAAVVSASAPCSSATPFSWAWARRPPP